MAPKGKDTRESQALGQPDDSAATQDQPAQAPGQARPRPSGPAAPAMPAGRRQGLEAAHYGAPLTGFDEMIDADGRMRDHWQPFMEQLRALPEGDMATRWERGLRLIRDGGMTYTIYGDPDGHGRPWTLDPMPLLVSSREWAFVERALQQRATLFNGILADLYGPRHLLNEGLLPPATVHANPGFLRPMHGSKPKDNIFLHFYAADLARSPDGRWWVINDRTDAPSGAGYALENRIIISRILPDFYRSTNVQRLAPFFMKLRETLAKLAPRPVENPRIVLWTPGPYNETHYEHVYLARYLGLTLVEGEDMTCRDGKVYLKTLDGLKQVDVIIRRNEGSWCDPLELRGESTLGVPGLVTAIHAGNVTVANALGTRLVEAPGLMPFLPSLCRRLLGEDLLMPSVATWWCGQPRERDYVRENLEQLAVRSAFNVHARAVDGAGLPDEKRAALLADMDAQPWAYVGQEAVNLSTAPVWSMGKLLPRPMAMRVHVVAHDGGYAVMPGGLTRVAPTPNPRNVSMQRGGGSKDTWVLADEPVAPVTLLRGAGGRERPVRGSRDLPSRVADNTYWLGRYAERCEDTTRLLRKACSVAAENGYGDSELTVVLSILALLGHCDLEQDLSDPAVQETTLRAILGNNMDPEHIGGLAATGDCLRRTATAVRDRLSIDTWRVISQLVTTTTSLTRPGKGRVPDLETPQAQLDGLIITLLALDGLALENMTRGLGWRFLDIGRRIERAMHVLDMVTGLIMVPDEEVGPALDVILEISDSAMTYRSRYLALPTLVPVLDVLMIDESNPRSLAYQLERLSVHMDSLATDQAFGLRTDEQRIMISLLSAVRACEADKITLADPRQAPVDPALTPLGDLLRDLRDGLARLADQLTLHYFAHAVETRPEMAGHPDLKAAAAVAEQAALPDMLPADPDPDAEEDDSADPAEEIPAGHQPLSEMAPPEPRDSQADPAHAGQRQRQSQRQRLARVLGTEDSDR